MKRKEPVAPPYVAVMVAEPAVVRFTVTTPLDVTVAVTEFEVVQVAVDDTSLEVPSLIVTVAAICTTD